MKKRWTPISAGPVFVMLYLYDGTRSFFNHFVNTGVTLIIQQVLIAAVMALILQTVTTAAGDRNADPALQASTLIYLYLFVGYIMYEIPHLAQRLAGNGFGASWSSFGGSRSEATRNADLPELSDGTRGAGRNGVGMSGGGPSGSAPQAPRPGTRTETAHSVPGMAQSSPSRAGGLGHAGNFADQESPSQSVSTTGAAMDANAAGQDGFAAALQRGVASMAHPRPNEGNVLAGGQSTSSDGMGRGVGSGVGGVMGRGTGRSIQGGAGLDSGSQASASEPRLGASSDTGAGSAFGHSRAAGDGLGGVPASASEHTTRTETAQSEQRADVPVGRGATAVASRGVAIPDNQEPTDQFS